MTEDPIRGRFSDVGSDVIVMPVLAGISTLLATHNILSTHGAHVILPTGLTAGSFLRWFSFGIISHLAFSFSLLYRHRSKSMLLLSLLRSCALTTYMFAFYLVSSHRPISYVSALGTFFVLTLLYQTFRYNLHFDQLVRHQQAVLIVGTGREAQKTWRHLRIHCDQLVTFKGFVSDAETRDAAPDILARTVCTIDSLHRYFHQTAVDTVILTAKGQKELELAIAATQIAKDCGVRILCAQQTKERHPLLRWLRADGDGYVELERSRLWTRATHTFKAVIGRAMAGAVMLFLMPLTVTLLLFYQLILGEFPLVSQLAYGYQRRPYKMWDLRIAASKQRLTYDDSRMRIRRLARVRAKMVARVGHFLSISGLARAPRLWNVFAGDMSLVGPKPVLLAHVSLSDATVLLRRFTMRPGLCWPKPVGAQTEDEATLCYVEHWNIGLDWKTFTHWLKSRVRRTLLAISTPLLPDASTLTEPTQRT